MIIPFIAPLLVYLEVALVFYPLVIALIVLSILCLPADLSPVEKRRGKGNPPLSLILNVLVFAVALYHFGIDVGSWKRWLPLAGIYLATGVVWATAKWWVFCGKVRDGLKDIVRRFNLTVTDGDNADDVSRGFMAYLFNDSTLYKYKSTPYVHENMKPWPRNDVINVYIPQVTSHKSVVLTWLFCWPMSVLKWMLADMLRNLYDGVFTAIKGAFQKIAAARFTDI